jgi:biotin synthase
MTSPIAAAPEVRHDWTDAEIRVLHDLPLPELLYRAQSVHRAFHDPTRVQLCTLLSIKTGGCPEDCGYCPQSAHHATGVERQKLLALDTVVDAARAAREAGSSRFCMGAAWREVREGADFERVLEMVAAVAGLGLEVCCTLGMLTDEQARRLAAAGLTAYNHNLDTGPGYYDRIVSTRTYDDRLRTLASVQEAGISVCCGGILGMGESVEDRVALLGVLARMDPHPGSVPVNALVAVEGTPLADRPPVSGLEMARVIATARLVMPRALVRLSAGRAEMSDEAQALCLIAGANSIFTGERLLTTANPGVDADAVLFARLGLAPMPAPAMV